MTDDTRHRNRSGYSIISLLLSIAALGIAIFIFCTASGFMADMHAKNVVQWCRKWESAQLTYYFKRDKLAGDKNGNGIIADESYPESPVMELIGSKVISESSRKIEQGDSTFYMKIGFDTIKNMKKNVFVICPSPTCMRTLTKAETAMMERIDKIMDGNAVASNGNFRGVTGVTLNCEGDAVTDVSEDMVLAAWENSSYVGAVYYFDDSRR